MVDYVPNQLSSQDLAYITRCYNKCQKCDKKFNEFTCNDCDLHPAMMVYRSLPVLVKGRMKEKSAFMDTLEKQEENYQKQNKFNDKVSFVGCMIGLVMFTILLIWLPL